ncbi:L,D-transpeptidase family protein [Sphingomonas montanisoli]|uniref:L,D-transpeptidase family protein n=1 Tax=Sphingomonas montanisoli TaxID=2606412 RepID=A0A5D9CC38_9SPHN|nr:L,D-transpeptidase family protein [Sphingomonas montanisoli]TZG29528.1 L,D-transpeptidase family protein [Sphingomonas montanisoli]
MFRVASRKSVSPTNLWAERRKRQMRATRVIAALPVIALVAILRGNAPAQAEERPSVDTIEMARPAPVEGRWSVGDAKDLLKAVEASAAEGLDPADYSADALRSAVATGQKGDALDQLANGAALRLAHDYADGRIDDKAAFDWHIQPQTDLNALKVGLDQALDDDKVDTWLDSLLPDNHQYRALKAAYAEADPVDSASRARLAANMERWRWMPRDLGDRYIYVNVPTYQLQVMEDGREAAIYNVVVGAPKTPTPQLLLHASSVVANPSWTVPQSIINKGELGRGVAAFRRPDGSIGYRQPPGPRNALGQIKIDMPNPYAIYLHDTPTKSAFARDKRALSHGCIRVQNISELASSLEGDSGQLNEALAQPKTKVLQLQKSMPVYIVYFTAQADANGTIRYLDDPYDRDTKMTARLNPHMQMASN